MKIRRILDEFAKKYCSKVKMLCIFQVKTTCYDQRLAEGNRMVAGGGRHQFFIVVCTCVFVYLFAYVFVYFYICLLMLLWI